MSASEEEIARMIRQQAEDLGNHRLTALPLSDRQPGRRGAPPRPARLLQGAGDARFLLGPRPGGANQDTGPSRQRAVPVEERWLDLEKTFDLDEGVFPNPTPSGHELTSLMKPEIWLQETPLALLVFVEGLVDLTLLLPPANAFEGDPFQLASSGAQQRRHKLKLIHQGEDHFHNQGPLVQTFLDMEGLMHDEGTFFSKMTRNTGLRCPPMVMAHQAQRGLNNLARPMASAKDPIPQATGPHARPNQPLEQPKPPVKPSEQPVEQPKQHLEQPKQHLEQPKQPLEQPKQPLEQPKQPLEQPRPQLHTSGFVPPHLRHTLRKQEPTEPKVENKSIATTQPKVESTPVGPKVNELPRIPVTVPVTTHSPVSAQASAGKRPPSQTLKKENSPTAEGATKFVPRAPTIPLGPLPSERFPSPTLQNSKDLLAAVPKLIGDTLATFTDLSEFLTLAEFANPSEFAVQFWNFIAKPLWGHLLWDYEDVQQQLIFLTWFYAKSLKSWKDVVSGGPPTREFIIQITQEFMDEEDKAKLAERTAVENKFKEMISPKLGTTPEPPQSWWKMEEPDANTISDWASGVQQSHRNILMESIKTRLSEETDPVQTQILYARLGQLMHQSGWGPGSTGSAPRAQKPDEPMKSKESTKANNEKDSDVPVLVLEKKSTGKDKISSAKPIREDNLDPEDSLSSLRRTFSDSTHLSRPHTPVEPPRALISAKPISPFKGKPIPLIPLHPPKSPNPPNRHGHAERAAASEAPTSFRRSPHAPRNQTNAQNVPPTPQNIRSTYRDPSEERREREKQERMEAINAQFAALKAGKPRGTDGSRESPPSLPKIPDYLLNFGPDAVYQIASKEMVDDIEEQALGERESLEKGPPQGQEDSLFDAENPTEEFVAVEDILDTQAGISDEEVHKIREMNRDSVSGLAITCPWKMGMRFASPTVPGESFIVELDCTSKMPEEFLKQLRDQVNPEDWEPVSSHPGFQDIVAQATKQFVIKMANKWGAQFIHGIAD
ncbi:hypothetical protein TWF730_003477 [Orbilia blumenaviensis]|uniref:Uncharacterized protein n=1 Tax=Orbilia blumenaviensis TaxID=1796055 RepID=A0AAV9U508_9PEZI